MFLKLEGPRGEKRENSEGLRDRRTRVFDTPLARYRATETAGLAGVREGVPEAYKAAQTIRVLRYDFLGSYRLAYRFAPDV